MLSSNGWPHVFCFVLCCLVCHLLRDVVLCCLMLYHVVCHDETVVGHTRSGLPSIVLCCVMLSRAVLCCVVL